MKSFRARLAAARVTGQKKVVDVAKYYSTERLRPKYESFLRQPLFIMTSDI